MIRNKFNICLLSLVICATLITKPANCWPQSKPVSVTPQEEVYEDVTQDQSAPQPQPQPAAAEPPVVTTEPPAVSEDGGYDYDNSTMSNSTADYEYYDSNNSTGGNINTTDYYEQYYYYDDNSTGIDNSSTSLQPQELTVSELPTDSTSDFVLRTSQQTQTPVFNGDNLNPNPLNIAQQLEKLVPQTLSPIVKPFVPQYIPQTRPTVIPNQQINPLTKPPFIINKQYIPPDERYVPQVKETQPYSKVVSDQIRQRQPTSRQQPIPRGEQPPKRQPIVPLPQQALPQIKPKSSNILPIIPSQSPNRQTQSSIRESETTPSVVSDESEAPPGNGIKREVRRAHTSVTKKPPTDMRVKPVNSAQQSSSDPLNAECLAAHNVYRKKHRVPPFQIDPKLVQVAEQRAKALRVTDKLAHDFEISFGENLHSRKNAKTINCDIVVKSWYNEIKDYNFDKPKLVPENLHFAQIMWKSTTSVGCAQGYSEKSRKIYTVCNYSPEGNVVGEELQMILRPS